MAVQHKGFRFNRTKHNDRELVFQKCRENENESAVKYNGSREVDFLQYLFTAERDSPLMTYRCKRVVNITNKHRMIVATVIQWLGSNVGFCFLERMLDAAGYKIVRKENG